MVQMDDSVLCRELGLGPNQLKKSIWVLTPHLIRYNFACSFEDFFQNCDQFLTCLSLTFDSVRFGAVGLFTIGDFR